MSRDVAKWLKQLLKFRESEYAQAQEFNGFNYEDNEDFNDETKKISDEIVKIENEAENACQCKVLDIDEAISHAEDIAARGDSVCHKNHNQLAAWLRELKDLRS